MIALFTLIASQGMFSPSDSLCCTCADLQIEKSLVVIDDPDVERAIQILRKQRATFEKVERAAQDGDEVGMDYVGKIDGKEFEGGAGQGGSVQLGEGRLLADFEKNVIGLEAGEVKEFELTF